MKQYIDCRSTGRGAYTSIIAHEQPSVTVREVDRSRTGNHWREVVVGPPGELYVLQDISNSGKHNCAVFAIGHGEPLLPDLADEYECVCECPEEALALVSALARPT